MVYISYGILGRALTLIESDSQGILSHKQQYDTLEEVKAAAFKRAHELSADNVSVEVGGFGEKPVFIPKRGLPQEW